MDVAALVACGQLPGLPQPFGAAMRAAAAGLPALLAAPPGAGAGAGASDAALLPLGPGLQEPRLSLARGAVTIIRQGSCAGEPAGEPEGAPPAGPEREAEFGGGDEGMDMEEADALVPAPRGEALGPTAAGEAAEPLQLRAAPREAAAWPGSPGRGAAGPGAEAEAAAPPPPPPPPPPLGAPPGCPPLGRMCELLMALPEGAARLGGALGLSEVAQGRAQDAALLLRCVWWGRGRGMRPRGITLGVCTEQGTEAQTPSPADR
jgi:hypothetical protein